MTQPLTAIDLSLPPEELAARVTERLAQPLPGAAAQRVMAPELAYGRHAGPAAIDARDAAVLVLLYPRGGQWLIPAMVRPDAMTKHAGQVALPGGVVEMGESPTETALREFEEELGAPRAGIHLAGLLSPVYVFNSNYLIQPVVVVAGQPPPFAPNPLEAAALVEIPVRVLLSPQEWGSHLVRRLGLVFRAPHYPVGPYEVWGATSMILAELGAVLSGQ